MPARLWIPALLFGLALLVPATPAAADPPWETWRDLRRLATLPAGDQVLLRSSHCPDGCRFDRASPGASRHLRQDGDESVIFEELGAGAIVRIWMTQGPGHSVPLDSAIRLRVRFDGEDTPRIDLPLPDVFRGDTPPFLAPLVADRLLSSGGNVSHVPLAYRRGCRVSLVGADAATLWFQFTFHRLHSATGVRSFRGDEDLSGLARLLATPGADPWRGRSGAWLRGSLSLGAGQEATLRAPAGPGLLNGLRLRLAAAALPSVDLLLDFDGERRVDMPLPHFFGAGVRSLLLGQDVDGFLYSYFALPFHSQARVRLRNRSAAAVAVEWELRLDPRGALPGSARFGAELRQSAQTPIGADIPLLARSGRGRLVGLRASLQSVATASREYLEGDERIYLDGSPQPMLYGTGVEDLFGGGFYFDQGPFGLALHGAPVHELTPAGEDRTGMYRLFVLDPVPWRSGIRAGLEGGPTANLALRAETVAYFYSEPEPQLAARAFVDVGDAGSRSAAGYEVDGSESCGVESVAFESEPRMPLSATLCSRLGGASRFTLDVAPRPRALRLRRRLDGRAGGQAASVFVNGRPAGRFPELEPNADRALREIDLDLPRGVWQRPGRLRFEVVPLAAGMPFVDVRYELLASP